MSPTSITGEGNGTPLQYSCLENPMDGGAWWAAVHGVAKSRTRLSDFPFTFHFHALEKEMATHSSVLAWRIPGMAEPGGLPSMGSHRVRQRLKWLSSSSSSNFYNSFLVNLFPLDITDFIYFYIVFFKLEDYYFTRVWWFFCHTSIWISIRYAYGPFLLNLPPTSHPILPL